MRIYTHDELWAIREDVLFMQIDLKNGSQGPLMCKQSSYMRQDETTFDWVNEPGGIAALQMPFNYLPLSYENMTPETTVKGLEAIRESGESLEVELTDHYIEHTSGQKYYLVLDRADAEKHLQNLQEVLSNYPAI